MFKIIEELAVGKGKQLIRKWITDAKKNPDKAIQELSQMSFDQAIVTLMTLTAYHPNKLLSHETYIIQNSTDPKITKKLEEIFRLRKQPPLRHMMRNMLKDIISATK
ncbi:hypothetical protein HZC20_01140 [Candidatus Peregrinibacteria bacterium]|nr:hypothetical protein [Candidatus Peregrinibacteria bacterium]